ncbi:FAD-dependent oxidoreductase [Ramlibacter sp. AN1015]|uniref:FAD-dependent oxidoreductase n=1 Tax=Ramlibacter sp. AN1015 TaxID=3133428 RepID=UPI0030C1CAA8
MQAAARTAARIGYLFARERGAASVRIYARSLRARAELVARVPRSHVHVGSYRVAEARVVDDQSFDQILVLYGYEPHASALLGLPLALRPGGFVQTDEQARTSLPGVYAIGELAERAHPCCVTAMADGVVAAKSIQHGLEPSMFDRSMQAQCDAAGEAGGGIYSGSPT